MPSARYRGDQVTGRKHPVCEPCVRNELGGVVLPGRGRAELAHVPTVAATIATNAALAAAQPTLATLRTPAVAAQHTQVAAAAASSQPVPCADRL